jgi:hypothetical protein
MNMIECGFLRFLWFSVYLPSESLTQPELHTFRTDDKQILDSLASRPTFWTLAMPPAWHRYGWIYPTGAEDARFRIITS